MLTQILNYFEPQIFLEQPGIPFMKGGPEGCRHGSKCKYAHGRDELRGPRESVDNLFSLWDEKGKPKSKNQRRKEKAKKSKSKEGNPFVDARYKTILCNNWIDKGHCMLGSKCLFAHGSSELRPFVPPPREGLEHARSVALPQASTTKTALPTLTHWPWIRGPDDDGTGVDGQVLEGWGGVSPLGSPLGSPQAGLRSLCDEPKEFKLGVGDGSVGSSLSSTPRRPLQQRAMSPPMSQTRWRGWGDPS